MSDLKRNKKFLEKSFVYYPEMEHEACGVGLIASTNGKKSRKVVEIRHQKLLKLFGIEGAVDADGKSGDGAGIEVEISPDFFNEKITEAGPLS